MALVQFQTNLQELNLMQKSWATSINPVLALPLSKALILPSVKLVSGDNVINHLLGRKLQGWIIVDVNGQTQVYRSAPKNDLTLTLNSSATVVADILVY